MMDPGELNVMISNFLYLIFFTVVLPLILAQCVLSFLHAETKPEKLVSRVYAIKKNPTI